MTVFEVVANFVSILAQVLTVAIIVRAILSWVMPNETSGLVRILYDITEPVLAPIRRILPPVAGIDFSPFLAMILIQVLSQLLISNLPAV